MKNKVSRLVIILVYKKSAQSAFMYHRNASILHLLLIFLTAEDSIAVTNSAKKRRTEDTADKPSDQDSKKKY